MWILYACGSAVFAGVTSILAKCGIRKTNSNVATAIRTIVVLLFSWIMVFVTGAQNGLADLTPKTLLFLALSGLATGASWLCYFRALQLGDVSRVAPVDKSSIILTILLAFVIFHETVSLFKVLGMVMIGAGTFLMIQRTKIPVSNHRTNPLRSTAAGRKDSEPQSITADRRTPGSQTTAADRRTPESQTSVADRRTPESQTTTADHKASEPQIASTSAVHASHRWLFYAVLSAVFASLTSILAKIGITGIDSNLGTAIRTCVVLVMAWVVVFATKKQDALRTIPHSELLFICLSGLATGASWLCYYRALQDGPASIVVPIDKLSILVTVAFSCVFLHERLSKRGAAGLALVTAGTLLMLL